MDLADARIPLDDRGLLVGDGIFETMRSIDGQVVFRDAHRERFAAGLHALGLDVDTAAFDTATDALLATVDGDAYLRLQATAGPMLDVPGPGTPRVSGIAKPFVGVAPERLRDGIALVTSAYKIQHDSPLAGIKHLSFLPYIAAKRDALARGADDALLLNTRNRPAEVSTANLFLRRDDTVYAPGATEGAVAGVTRRAVVDLLTDMDVEVEEASPTSSGADEMWITNTTGGVTPVRAVDGRAIPIGELTRALQDGLEARMRRP